MCLLAVEFKIGFMITFPRCGPFIIPRVNILLDYISEIFRQCAVLSVNIISQHRKIINYSTRIIGFFKLISLKTIVYIIIHYYREMPYIFVHSVFSTTMRIFNKIISVGKMLQNSKSLNRNLLFNLLEKSKES